MGYICIRVPEPPRCPPPQSSGCLVAFLMLTAGLVSAAGALVHWLI